MWEWGPEAKEQSRELREGQAARADGTVIDLTKVRERITEAIAFAEEVKIIETLVKSINTLAKGIGKKIQNGDTLVADENKNGTLIAAVFSLVLDIKDKLTKLEAKSDKFIGIKEKVTAAKAGSAKFITTVKGKTTELGKNAATDTHTQDSIDIISKPNGDKGAKDLADLNNMIDDLFKATETMVSNAIKELTTFTNKPDTIKN